MWADKIIDSQGVSRQAGKSYIQQVSEEQKTDQKQILNGIKVGLKMQVSTAEDEKLKMIQADQIQ